MTRTAQDHESPGEKSPKTEGEKPGFSPDEIRDPAQILRMLKKAHENEEKVEITINDRTRTYFTYFVDHLPELPSQEDPAAENGGTAAVVSHLGSGLRKEIAPYEPFSYLKTHSYLLIAPLIPAIGNAQIRSSRLVNIRFFEGVKSLEGAVGFVETTEVRGEPVLKIGYPKTMVLQRTRRHFRAPVPETVELTLTVKKSGLPPFAARVIDISVGGLGFCNSQLPELLPIGDPVSLELSVPEHPLIRITAYIRNHGRTTNKEGCAKDQSRTGVQFDLTNESAAMQVEELVALVQREFLQELQDRKKGTFAKPVPHEPEEHDAGGNKLQRELSKLFGMKKDYRFK